MIRRPPLSRLARQWIEANLVGAKQPLRWMRTRSSQSSSAMLKIIRSRRMPCAQTRMSRSPKVSSAVCTARSAVSMSAMSPPTPTASPPAARIDSTTASMREAGPPLRPSTSRSMSHTTTFAPCSPKTLQISEPMPPAPPVTRATLPSRCFVTPASFAPAPPSLAQSEPYGSALGAPARHTACQNDSSSPASKGYSTSPVGSLGTK